MVALFTKPWTITRECLRHRNQGITHLGVNVVLEVGWSFQADERTNSDRTTLESEDSCNSEHQMHHHTDLRSVDRWRRDFGVGSQILRDLGLRRLR